MAALDNPRQTQLMSKVNEAVEAGEKFIEIFYDTVDKRRQVMSGFYSNASTVVWNGNTHTSAAKISDFYQSLPGSEHRVFSYDCQPILSAASTVLVSCRGVVKLDGEREERKFSQNFLLSKEGEVWKVASDCFRFVER